MSDEPFLSSDNPQKQPLYILRAESSFQTLEGLEGIDSVVIAHLVSSGADFFLGLLPKLGALRTNFAKLGPDFVRQVRGDSTMSVCPDKGPWFDGFLFVVSILELGLSFDIGDYLNFMGFYFDRRICG